METDEDYSKLVHGLRNLNFTGHSIPCKLLLTGDSVFPVMVTPSRHVLIAASKFGKGRMVVLGHESYLNKPEFMSFLNNAIQWLKPSLESVVGVDRHLDHLIQHLFAQGHAIEAVSAFKNHLGVLCIDGYVDREADKIIAFMREGGGLLIGAQAWYWSQCKRGDNVLLQFPGNKITSVAGVYFTDKCGEKGDFTLSEKMPQFPIYYDVDFSKDIKQLLTNVSKLDISGSSIGSHLLLHGPLTFSLGVTKKNECFIGAAYYGKGRIVVLSHEAYIYKNELSTFIVNAISWLTNGRKGKVGVHKLDELCPLLQKEAIPFTKSDLTPDLSLYCTHCYSDKEAEKIHQFVSEGGGLLIGGHAWYWSYKNPDALSKFPGNKILNKFGISVLEDTIEAGFYDAPADKSTANTYHFLRAVNQLVNLLHQGTELQKPLSLWLWKLRQDICYFLKLPYTPLISSIKRELVHLIAPCNMPSPSKQCPVNTNSKEALIMCLAHDVSCIDDNQDVDKLKLQDASPVTLQLDAQHESNAWISTGLYVPPRRHVLLVFPAAAVKKGLQVQVGCQSDNLISSEKLCRAPVVILRKSVETEKVVVFCIWGGLLYLIVKKKTQLGTIPVKVYGAEPAPTYIKGQTSLSSWLEAIHHLPAPWAELITEDIALTVPTESIRMLEDPDTLLSLWDKIMNAVSDLACSKFKFKERIVADVQISAGFMHSGYPIMIQQMSANDLVNIEKIKKGIWGIIHELGHNQQKAVCEFPPHTTEATCNLWSVYVHETVLGIPREKAHEDLSPSSRQARIVQYLKNGANLKDWNVWTALETYLQLQEAFGWESYKHVFNVYKNMATSSNNNKDKMNLWAETFSNIVNRNLSPFFKAWGWPIEDKVSTKLSSLPAWKEDPMITYTAQLQQ